MFWSNMVNLDVLVVYAAPVAVSASVSDFESKFPFLATSANYNLAYAYFLQVCRQSGLKAGFTTSADIVGPGKCNSYWTYSANQWHKNEGQAKALQIFDKLSPICAKSTAQRLLLLDHEEIRPFNEAKLHQTFFDKLKTFKQFSRFGVPTVALFSSRSSDIQASISRLSDLMKKDRSPDFLLSNFILKDRYGSGGNNIYKLEGELNGNIKKLMLRQKKVRFILQPFLNFDKGYAYKEKRAATDIRLIYHDNEIIQCYIRTANAKDFRCNLHQGGNLAYINPEKIPIKIRKTAREIVTQIDDARALYALDFVVGNSGRVFFLEGNTGPGINWDENQKNDEIMAKRLIKRIVGEIGERIKLTKDVGFKYGGLAQYTLPGQVLMT